MSDEPSIRPEDVGGQKGGRGRLGLISLFFLVLIGVVVYYFYLKRHDPGFEILTIVERAPTSDPAKLGRQVTFVSISPLTAPFYASNESRPAGLRSTVYTKIGSKAVPASGRLDVLLYQSDEPGKEAAKRQDAPICTWSNITLPDSADWGRWPLGGWNLTLTWDKQPAVASVWVEAVYTNPVGKVLKARQGPIRIGG